MNAPSSVAFAVLGVEAMSIASKVFVPTKFGSEEKLAPERV